MGVKGGGSWDIEVGDFRLKEGFRLWGGGVRDRSERVKNNYF